MAGSGAPRGVSSEFARASRPLAAAGGEVLLHHLPASPWALSTADQAADALKSLVGPNTLLCTEAAARSGRRLTALA
jgi:hypothetical protein